MRFYQIPPVLITCCISSSDPLTKLEDPKERLFHVLEGVGEWLEIKPDLRLVLCDGSNFDLGPIVKVKFPNANIECLHHQNSSLEIAKKGKGYGEGEIIKYALKNSKFIAESSVFIKCTGKLWVENFMKCLDEWNGKFMANVHFANIFSFLPAEMEYVDTRFYVTEKQFYIDNLMDLYLETNFGKNGSIENFFLKKIQSLSLNNYIYSVDPIICGVGGGSGEYYKNNATKRIKRKLRKIYLRRDQFFKGLIFNKAIINP
jgi:hypothetical protein